MCILRSRWLSSKTQIRPGGATWQSRWVRENGVRVTFPVIREGRFSSQDTGCGIGDTRGLGPRRRLFPSPWPIGRMLEKSSCPKGPKGRVHPDSQELNSSVGEGESLWERRRRPERP